jgi:hypothetical protein
MAGWADVQVEHAEPEGSATAARSSVSVARPMAAHCTSRSRSKSSTQRDTSSGQQQPVQRMPRRALFRGGPKFERSCPPPAHARWAPPLLRQQLAALSRMRGGFGGCPCPRQPSLLIGSQDGGQDSSEGRDPVPGGSTSRWAGSAAPPTSRRLRRARPAARSRARPLPRDGPSPPLERAVGKGGTETGIGSRSRPGGWRPGEPWSFSLLGQRRRPSGGYHFRATSYYSRLNSSPLDGRRLVSVLLMAADGLFSVERSIIGMP